MPVQLRRIIIYSIATLSLLYMTEVLQRVVRDLLLRVGFTDALTLGGLPDLISALPIFSDIRADVVVVLVGVGSWLLIRHDRQNTSNGKGNRVRAFFIAGLAAALGLLMLFSVLIIAFNAESLSQQHLPMAVPLAGALSWGVALVTILVEWRLGGQRFDNVGERIAMFFAYLGQWVLAIFIIWSIGSIVQSVLQRMILPLPLCSAQPNITAQIVAFIQRFTGQCTAVPPLFSAMLTATVTIAAVAIYVRWGGRYRNMGISNTDAIVGTAIAGFFILLNCVLGVRLLLDISAGSARASFPRSLLSSPGSLAINTYPFLGPLVACASVLVFYYWRTRRKAKANGSNEQLYGLMTFAFELGAVFFVGVCTFIGDVFVVLLRNVGVTSASVTTDDWLLSLMLVIPGFLLGLALWRSVDEMGRWGNRVYSPTPRKIYVTVFYQGLRGAVGFSLLIILGLVVTALLRTPIDPTNAWALRMIAVTLVIGLFLPYYRNLWLLLP